VKAYLDELQGPKIHNKFQNAVVSKLKEDYESLSHANRIRFENTDSNEVKLILKQYFPHCKINIIEPKSKKLGGFSEKYFSFEIEANKNIKIDDSEFEKGSTAVVINATQSDSEDGVKRLIFKKQLSPAKLNLIHEYTSLDSLVMSTIAGLKNANIDKSLVAALTKLINELKNETKTVKSRAAGVLKIENFSDSITFSNKLKEQMSVFNKKDITQIGIDFGEILGAIYLMKRYAAKTVEFPNNPTNELIDSYIEGQPISSKYEKGAAPSIASLKKQIYDNKMILNSIKKKEDGEFFLQTLEAIDSLRAGYNSLKCHELLKTKLYRQLKKFDLLKEDDNSTIAAINTFLKQNIKKHKSSVEKFYDFIDSNFYKYTISHKSIRVSTMKEFVDNVDVAKDIAGIIIGPATYDLVDILNNKFKLLLNIITKALDIKQLYLWIKLSEAKLDFVLKSFDISTFKFYFNTGAKTYDQVKISFKME
jgi:hypothetical protein